MKSASRTGWWSVEDILWHRKEEFQTVINVGNEQNNVTCTVLVMVLVHKYQLGLPAHTHVLEFGSLYRSSFRHKTTRTERKTMAVTNLPSAAALWAFCDQRTLANKSTVWSSFWNQRKYATQFPKVEELLERSYILYTHGPTYSPLIQLSRWECSRPHWTRLGVTWFNPMAWGWSKMIFEVPSYPNHSVTL